MDRFIIELSNVINGPMGLGWVMTCSYIVVACFHTGDHRWRDMGREQ